MSIRPGTIGLESLLKRTSKGDAEMLDVEYTVMSGEYDKRKIFDNMLLNGTTAGHSKAIDISRSKLRAIFEAINNIDPNDSSPSTTARRASATLAGFQGATFLCTLEVETGRKKETGGFWPDKNVVGDILRLGDPGYRRLDQPPPQPIARSTPPAQSPPQMAPSTTANGAPRSNTAGDRASELGGVMMMTGMRKIGVPIIESVDDIWQRRATAAAIQAVREIINAGGTIPPAIQTSKLSDVQIGWLNAASLFAWIKCRSEQAAAEGWDTETALRLSALDPEPWDAGAVAHILPQLGALPDVDWSVPIGAWPKDTMVCFLLQATKLISQAMIARDVGGSVTTTKHKSISEMQRIASAEAGGPLLTPDELNDQIPF